MALYFGLALWLLVLLNTVILMKHIKFVSKVNEMISKAPERRTVLHGTEKGIPVEGQIPVTQVNGVELFKQSKSRTLLLFTAIGCKSCNGLYPILKTLTQKYPDTHIVVFMRGNQKDIDEKIQEHLINVPVVQLEDEFIEQAKIQSFPFAYILGSDNKVLGKAVITLPEHLDELYSRTIERR
jgi:hypothetical protein